jgi:hypothetical protein
MKRRRAWTILAQYLQGIYSAGLRVLHTGRFQPIRPFPLSTYAISTWYYYSSSTLLFSRHEESRCTVEVWVLRLYDRLTNLVISPQARTSLCRVGSCRIIRIVGRWSLCLLAVYCFLQLNSLLCGRAEAFLRTRSVVIVLGDR